MDTKNHNFNLDFNHEVSIVIAIIVLALLVSFLIMRNPDSPIIELVITSLVSFILGLAINPTKKIN